MDNMERLRKNHKNTLRTACKQVAAHLYCQAGKVDRTGAQQQQPIQVRPLHAV